MTQFENIGNISIGAGSRERIIQNIAARLSLSEAKPRTWYRVTRSKPFKIAVSFTLAAVLVLSVALPVGLANRSGTFTEQVSPYICAVKFDNNFYSNGDVGVEIYLNLSVYSLIVRSPAQELYPLSLFYDETATDSPFDWRYDREGALELLNDFSESAAEGLNEKYDVFVVGAFEDKFFHEDSPCYSYTATIPHSLFHEADGRSMLILDSYLCLYDKNLQRIDDVVFNTFLYVEFERRGDEIELFGLSSKNTALYPVASDFQQQWYRELFGL